MKTRNRLVLMGVALSAGVCLGTPSIAQGLAAQSAKIAELERAGKYAEAIPLAQAVLANQEKGPPSRDLAGALNNLAQLYGTWVETPMPSPSNHGESGGSRFRRDPN